MEEYKELNQADDESEEPLSHPRARESTWCSFPRWVLWFTGGFFSALAAIMILAVVYTIVDRKEPLPGLIPDCK
jgi:hypothetical protein